MDLDINVINNWDKWKKTLYNAISIGDAIGLSDHTITNLGTRIGEFLASNVDPENSEQRLLKELFANANKIEQEALTSVIIKMVEKDH
jgi:hypothetical protein